MTEKQRSLLMERSKKIGADMEHTAEKIHTTTSDAQAENLIRNFTKQLEHMRELCSVLSLLDDKYLYECRPASPQKRTFSRMGNSSILMILHQRFLGGFERYQAPLQSQKPREYGNT